MIELEQDDIPEETECESIDLNDESPSTSEVFPRLTGVNYGNKVRFEPIPNESSAIGTGEEAASSLNPIYIYQMMGNFDQTGVRY